MSKVDGHWTTSSTGRLNELIRKAVSQTSLIQITALVALHRPLLQIFTRKDARLALPAFGGFDRAFWKFGFQSIAAKLLCCYRRKSSIEETSAATDDKNDEKLFEPDKETSPGAGPAVKESLLSMKFLAICIYATIAQTRMNSIPGWTYSWLQERIKFN